MKMCCGKLMMSVAFVGLCASTAFAQNVTYQDVLGGPRIPTRWLSVYGDYTGQHFSPLTEITPANAAQLVPRWTFQTNVIGNFEASPIVLDGVLYMTGALNNAWALDATTGKALWSYRYTLPQGLKVCCGPVNRGFAILPQPPVHDDARCAPGRARHQDRQGDLEHRARRLQARLRQHRRAAGREGQADCRHRRRRIRQPRLSRRLRSRDRQAGLAILDRARTGEPGSETWPADVLERGGAPTWQTGTYDPALNMLYWGTGNPNPDWDGDSRPGDNLYAASLMAINADSGKLEWHYQFTPHDTHDWDANQVPVLADIQVNGQPRKVVIQANRNGFIYVHRSHQRQGDFGQAVHETELGVWDWRRRGSPMEIPGHEPTEAGSLTCPDCTGHQLHVAVVRCQSRGLFFLPCARLARGTSAATRRLAHVGDR